MTMPINPNSPPPTRTAKRTQKLASPVLSPRIFGPRILPSNCCNARMNTRNHMHCSGSTISKSNAEGIAPINGPKNGMILVIPTMQLISSVYSHPKIVMHTKHSRPMIRESMILPLINPPKVLFVKEAPSRISFAVCSLKNATITFLLCAANRSLLFRK